MRLMTPPLPAASQPFKGQHHGDALFKQFAADGEQIVLRLCSGVRGRIFYSVWTSNRCRRGRRYGGFMAKLHGVKQQASLPCERGAKMTSLRQTIMEKELPMSTTWQ